MPGPDKRARVLIVDDDRTMLATLAEMVSGCGHEAIAVSTWTEAVRRFRADQPDAALLDVMMPAIDGYKLTRMLKTAADGFVPIILLTALDDIESKRRGMAAGADDFLTKPVAPLELQIRLSSMLRIKELTDEIAAVNARLAELAVTDALTGLPNRRAVDEHLTREFARSNRYGNAFSVLMLDIDHFKPVNDTYGHAVGDKVLALVGKALADTMRQTDLVGRYGGEEFIVVAPETSSANARLFGERIRLHVGRASARAPDLPGVTLSIGVASSDTAEVSTVEELVRLADAALYEAKRRGRNRCVAAVETATQADDAAGERG